MNNYLLWILSLLLSGSTVYAQELNKPVLNSNRGSSSKWLVHQSNHEALYRIISNEAFQLLDQREEKIAGLKTTSDWKLHQETAKNKLCASLSKFDRTPLNARITGTLERAKFTAEKILFESHPGFYVTACLFIPKVRQTPAPVVIYCAGHTELGFRSDTYQQVMLNLVEKGFIVFAFDPLGQGERLQYPDPATGKSKVGGPTREHSYAGVQTLLAGSSLSDYFIWDGIRAIDYLATRPEVDMNRIGITGRSGGGTQSAMIAACDDRIYAAAPECYITSFRRLLQSIGPQDAEQNPYNAIAKGFDHPDFLHIRAPKPTLMITTTHDFFSIQGVRETFAEAKKSYTAFGKPENLQMVEDMGGHESTKNNREALYAFFSEHLSLQCAIEDTQVEPFTIEELWVTPSGQVASSMEAETVYNLNKKAFSKVSLPKNELRSEVIRLSGMKFNRMLKAAVYTGKILTGGMQVEKYFLENHTGDFVLPVYVAKNESVSSGKLLLWQHPGGKEAILDHKAVASLIKEGYIIVSADLPGTGELYDPGFSGDGVIRNIPFNYTFGANLAGKSIPGIQAEALDLVVQFVESSDQLKNMEWNAVAEGTAASSLLHYTAWKNPARKIILLDSPATGQHLINEMYYDPGEAFYVVPGSLPVYGQEDLIGLLPAGTVKMLGYGSKEGKNGYLPAILEFLER
jgi:cephalosporin-C deacetylase-like acetyl esterase